MKKLMVIIIPIIVIALMVSCENTVGNGSSGKLNSIAESQRIILSRLESLKDVPDLEDRLSKIEQNQQQIIRTLTDIKKTSVTNSKKGKVADSNKPPTNTGPFKSDQVVNVNVGDSYFIGPADAKVTITEWMDYQ